MKTGTEAFDRLVEQVMSQQPYKSAPKVFWIMDNGSSHRGATCVKRLIKKWLNIVPVHLPVHASWLNQVEIYFSIIQRKALMPNDFISVPDLEERLIAFQERYETMAKPFEWKFTRQDLGQFMKRIDPCSEKIACCA